MKLKQSPKKSQSFSSFRIISGIWRRRKLPFPECEGLRPTPDRVRETLFNWLGSTLSNPYCLDLFAGSGALGLEALSRGARHCTFIDAERIAISTIEQNLALLNGQDYKVVCGQLPHVLGDLTSQFDLIFIDPPYSTPTLIVDCIDGLKAMGLIANQAMIYIEVAKTTTLPLFGKPLKLHKEKLFGQVRSYLFIYDPVE